MDGVIAICETAGRLDQILANLNTLYKAKDILGNIPVYQLARNSLAWLLRPGSHQINVGDAIVKKRDWCSLIPLGAGVEHVTTTGLKWNLSKCIYINVFHMFCSSSHALTAGDILCNAVVSNISYLWNFTTVKKI